MADKNEIKAMAERTGLPEDYVKDMLEFSERYEEQKKAVEPLAKALGITPEEYISRREQHQANLQFIASKGFDVSSPEGLRAALEWVKTTDPDNLLYGEGTGDPFDIQMGALRQGMLIETLSAELKKGNVQ